jgi:purine-binding chemotaxis protein CheW
MSGTGEAERVLSERARALARAPLEPETAGAMSELLEFRLARECYAIESRHVESVYPLGDLTPLPCTPPFILGIVSVRGRILPVLDIKKFFDLPEQGLTDLHRIIVVRGSDMELGLLADVIEGIRRVAVEELQPSLPTLTGIRADYLKGVSGERLVVLDVERILADPRIVVLEEVEG